MLRGLQAIKQANTGRPSDWRIAIEEAASGRPSHVACLTDDGIHIDPPGLKLPRHANSKDQSSQTARLLPPALACPSRQLHHRNAERAGRSLRNCRAYFLIDVALKACALEDRKYVMLSTGFTIWLALKV